MLLESKGERIATAMASIMASKISRAWTPSRHLSRKWALQEILYLVVLRRLVVDDILDIDVLLAPATFYQSYFSHERSSMIESVTLEFSYST